MGGCTYFSVASFTTGDALFAECSALCRVSKHGHSAKRQFVEFRTRQRPSLPSAKHSAKRACRVSGTRQTSSLPSVRHSAKNNPWQNTSGDTGGPTVILCRVLAVSTRQTCCLCRVSGLALGKEVPLPSANSDTRQSIFILFLFLFSNFFCGIYTVPWSTCSNLELFYDFLVYFLNFLCLLEFFSKK